MQANMIQIGFVGLAYEMQIIIMIISIIFGKHLKQLPHLYFQRTWKTEYDSLVESRSALLAFTYYFFLIMVRLLTDLFITSILCVVLTNVRDAHFKKTGIVTTHYKKLKLKASFRQNMLKDKNKRLSDSSVPTQSSSSVVLLILLLLILLMIID